MKPPETADSRQAIFKFADGAGREPGPLFMVPNIELSNQLTSEERRLWEDLRLASGSMPGQKDKQRTERR